MVEIGLFAVSDTTADQSVGAMEVILAWDATHLKLVSLRDPCPDDPCPANAYNWWSASFPHDGNPPAPWLNTDCGASEFCVPYTGLPYNDGNALFLALGKFVPNPARRRNS